MSQPASNPDEASGSEVKLLPGGVVQAFQKELSAFSTSKGTIRFQPDQPLPAALVKKFVKARMAKIGVAPARRAAPAKKKRR